MPGRWWIGWCASESSPPTACVTPDVDDQAGAVLTLALVIAARLDESGRISSGSTASVAPQPGPLTAITST